MAKKIQDSDERVDPETGEITQDSPVYDDDPDFAEVTGAAIDGDVEEASIHAYDAGEFHPELSKLMGDMRDFMLGRIRNNWKPWQQMTVDEQQLLVNAVEQQARDTIRGTVRALNDHDWPHCTVILGQVTIKGGDKGIEAKITCANIGHNRDILGEYVDKPVMVIMTEAETFFGQRGKVVLDGKGSQMDLPLGGSSAEAGGFEAEQEALRAPVLDGIEPDALAPDDDDKTDTEALWPDDQQLGERTADEEDQGEA